MRTAATTGIGTWVAAAAGVLAACSDGGAMRPALDREIALAYGDAVRIAAADLTLHFSALNEESRCPRDVACVWAGQATITLDASKPGAAPAALTLTLPTPDTAGYAGYSVRLLQLDPYPDTTLQPLVPEDYVATLVVSRP